jgi:hypothetical protein
LNQAHELALSGERDRNNSLWRTSLKKHIDSCYTACVECRGRFRYV